MINTPVLRNSLTEKIVLVLKYFCYHHYYYYYPGIFKFAVLQPEKSVNTLLFINKYVKVFYLHS